MTVRILRGSIELPFGEQPTEIDVPTEKGDRVVSFGVSGGYARVFDKPVRWNWWAYVTKENA